MPEPKWRSFKFELGGSFVFYSGRNLGEAIQAFITHRANRVIDIEEITEEPLKD